VRRLEPEEALALWDDFPIDRQPRPIVLMGSAIGPGGLPMLEDKADVLRRAAVVSDVDMPPWLLAALQPDPPPHWEVEPVHVRSVRRVYPEFRTDRGHRPFPAYRIDLQGRALRPKGAVGPKFARAEFRSMNVLDPAVETSMWWPPGLDTSYRGGALRHLPGAAVLTDHGRTISLMVNGSLPSCTDVSVDAVLESRTAVLPVIKETPYDWVDAIPLVAVGRLVTIRLSEPLGARVLVQYDGVPLAVLPG
jgi:hypothetical protein